MGAVLSSKGRPIRTQKKVPSLSNVASNNSNNTSNNTSSNTSSNTTSPQNSQTPQETTSDLSQTMDGTDQSQKEPSVDLKARTASMDAHSVHAATDSMEGAQSNATESSSASTNTASGQKPPTYRNPWRSSSSSNNSSPLISSVALPTKPASSPAFTVPANASNATPNHVLIHKSLSSEKLTKGHRERSDSTASSNFHTPSLSSTQKLGRSLSNSSLPQIGSTRDLSRDGHHDGRKTSLASDKSAPSLLSTPESMTTTTIGAKNSNSDSSTASRRGLIGLQNLGNTCFMNSALQCLFTIPQFERYFVQESLEKEINKKSPSCGEIALAFRDLLKGVWIEPSQAALSPVKFKREVGKIAPRFLGYNQQDAHEFLRFLLDGLHSDLNRVQKKQEYIERKDDDDMPDEQKAPLYWGDHLRRNDSIIMDLFCGQLKSSLRCEQCKHVSTCFDPFMDLSLPIPKTKTKDKVSRGAECSMKDCLDLLFKEEVLDGDERTTCGKCKKRQKSIKKLSFYRLPSILVISFKRFSNQSAYCDKVSTFVSFPQDELNLSSYCELKSEKSSYQLFAVSHHTGSLYGGHYTASCYHPAEKKWYSFNDSHVSHTTDDQIQGSSAYILFYQRKE
eukprot:TRINITY_DN771_c1_g1_i1.p1 TRINITY_DN771_c1_g1~~TRINITY_DN771_c1_g1_i1.p1  ORF type:complete len:619 (+),score=113.88 TRINITY_DN771_c1_g1_i1:40-1896(+)